MIQNMTVTGTSEDVKVKKIMQNMYSKYGLKNLTVTAATGIKRDKIKGLYIQQYDNYNLLYCAWSKFTNILETGIIKADSTMLQGNYGSSLNIDEEGTVALNSTHAGGTYSETIYHYTIFVFYID